MKKIIFLLGVVCFFTAFSAKAQGDYIVRVDVTGSQFINPCTGGTMTSLSGILQFNFAPDGITIRSTVIYKQVVVDVAGTKYHGIFLQTFETINTDNGLINTFKLVLNPVGGGPSINLHGVLQISLVNGVPTVLVNKYTLDCN